MLNHRSRNAPAVSRTCHAASYKTIKSFGSERGLFQKSFRICTPLPRSQLDTIQKREYSKNSSHIPCEPISTGDKIVKYQKDRKAYSRDERKHMIMQAFLVASSRGVNELTITDVAHANHITASTKLRDMLTELVIEGVIYDKKDPIPGIAKFRFLYSLSPFTDDKDKASKKTQRTITFKTRKNGQQALWTEVIS